MSKFPRETIILASAIVGANLLGTLTYSQAANSSGLCEGFTQMWQGTNRPSEPARGEPIGSYYDVRQKREVPFYRQGEAPVQSANTNGSAAPQARSAAPPVAHPAQPVARANVAASAVGANALSITDAEIDAAIARERQQPGAWVAENRLPNASEQADYQARRQSLLSPRGGI